MKTKTKQTNQADIELLATEVLIRTSMPRRKAKGLIPRLIRRWQDNRYYYRLGSAPTKPLMEEIQRQRSKASS